MPALVTFREVDPSDASMILSWRSKPRVTDFMNTDVDNDVNAQTQWLVSCFEKPRYYHWIFSMNGTEAGLLSIADFDLDAGTTSWGYYIGEDSLLGFGAVVPPYLYNWLFRTVGLRRVEVEVFANNEQVLRMHDYHGYRRVPDRDRSIEKSGREIQLRALELHAKDWIQQHRMQRFVAEFPVARWTAGPRTLSMVGDTDAGLVP